MRDRVLYRIRRATRQPAAPPRALPPGVLDCRLAVNEHGAYAVPRASEHRPAARAIIAGAVWEQATVELLRHSDPDHDVIHAGTFFGDFLPALGRSRSGRARVFAFEPNSENFRCAQITLLLNDLDNVVLTHAALDVRSGEGELAIRSADGLALGGGSHLVGAAQAGAGGLTEPVRLTSIDEVVPVDRCVGVVHLDVERRERAALEGGLATIRRCRPLLVVESPPSPEWFAEHLGELQYQVIGNVSGNSVLAPS